MTRAVECIVRISETGIRCGIVALSDPAVAMKPARRAALNGPVKLDTVDKSAGDVFKSVVGDQNIGIGDNGAVVLKSMTSRLVVELEKIWIFREGGEANSRVGARATR